MEEMQEKKIDNETIEIKEKMNELENLIDNQKQKIKSLDEFQEAATSLNKNLNKCIELLSLSLKGPKRSAKYRDMYETNQSTYKNTSSILDEEINETRSNINRLYEEKDILEKQNKENLNKEKIDEAKEDKEI